jgi:hypothetical protein
MEEIYSDAEYLAANELGLTVQEFRHIIDTYLECMMRIADLKRQARQSEDDGGEANASLI